MLLCTASIVNRLNFSQFSTSWTSRVAAGTDDEWVSISNWSPDAVLESEPFAGDEFFSFLIISNCNQIFLSLKGASLDSEVDSKRHFESLPSRKECSREISRTFISPARESRNDITFKPVVYSFFHDVRSRV